MKSTSTRMAGPHGALKLTVGFVLLVLASSQCWAYSGGQGTMQVPYVLSSPEDMIQLSTSPRDYDKHFVFKADIDLAGYTFDQAVIAPWDEPSVNPFDSEVSFTGTLNGNGHVVSNLTVIGENHLGLVGVLQPPGQIMGLGIVDANVTGTGRSIGMLAGYNDGHIRQCFAVGNVSGQSQVGGLVGRNDRVIENCFARGAASGIDSVGGLTGRTSWGEIHNAYSTCTLERELPLEDEGGLTGGYSRGRVFSGFWDMETSGIAAGEGGTGLTTVQMLDPQTFLQAGWDFVGEVDNGLVDIWLSPDSGGYPELSVFHGLHAALPFPAGTTLGRCTLSEDLNEVRWDGPEVLDVTWDHVSITDTMPNPMIRPPLDPSHRTRAITLRGSVDVLDTTNMLGIDARTGVVCRVLDEQGAPVSLLGQLSPFEPSFCWAMQPDIAQTLELQFQLDPEQPVPSMLSQVDFYVYTLDCDVLTTVEVPFGPMDTWQTLMPGYDVKIVNVIVEDGKWEYTLMRRVLEQPSRASIVPGATECEVDDADPGPRSLARLWGVDVLYDQRTIYGENHTARGGSIWGRSEIVDGETVYATTTSSTGTLDITRIEYTFALSTRKRVVPLTLKNIPMP